MELPITRITATMSHRGNHSVIKLHCKDHGQHIGGVTVEVHMADVSQPFRFKVEACEEWASFHGDFQQAVNNCVLKLEEECAAQMQITRYFAVARWKTEEAEGRYTELSVPDDGDGFQPEYDPTAV